MTTLSNRNPFQDSSIISTWFGIAIGLFVGIAGTILVGAGIANFGIDPGNAVNSLEAGALMVEQPEQPEQAAAPTLQQELETVRHRWQMNQQALMLLEADPRWEMPEQREHLTRAVQETAAVVEQSSARIVELEAELGQ